jgi:exodeoxyribonuclease III
LSGDFNVIPEDVDCQNPASWIKNALFRPEPRARYREVQDMGYTDAFCSLHPKEKEQLTFWDYFRQAFEHNREIRIAHFPLSSKVVGRLTSCGSTAVHDPAETVESRSDRSHLGLRMLSNYLVTP